MVLLLLYITIYGRWSGSRASKVTTIYGVVISIYYYIWCCYYYILLYMGGGAARARARLLLYTALLLVYTTIYGVVITIYYYIWEVERLAREQGYYYIRR